MQKKITLLAKILYYFQNKYLNKCFFYGIKPIVDLVVLLSINLEF